VGLFSREAASHALYDALTVLQHRGQDAAGIATCDARKLYLSKANGLVRDVFRSLSLDTLQGNMGLGHVRYPTAGSASETEAQPFYVNSPFGIALAHNGNLVNSAQLAQEVFHTDRRHVNTASDSEVLLNVLAHELQRIKTYHLTPDDIFSALQRVHARCSGGYAVVALIVGHGILGFRDPHGIRPLVYGKRETPHGDEYMIASESVALDILGYTRSADVAPGQAVYIDLAGKLHQTEKSQYLNSPPHTPCLFEFVYLARPDSIIEDISVYKARLYMGEKLAQNIKTQFDAHDIDVVIPVPDTSRTAALPLAYHLGVKCREGLIKNHYIGRTFMMPKQIERQRSVRQKLNVIASEFKDKNVLLVDDSIVRGTTSREIIQMARDAGARKVYFASAAPPVRYPNVYGIDMPTQAELIAHQRTESEIAVFLGADRLFYQDLADLMASVSDRNPSIGRFEASVFDGQYVTGDVTPAYLEGLGRARGEILADGL
jgi:amidophosphoribosyltransferase